MRIDTGDKVEDYAGRTGKVKLRETMRNEGDWVEVALDDGQVRHYRPRQLSVVRGKMRFPAE